MSKSTDTEIKDLIGAVDRKLDLLAKDISIVREDISTIKAEIKGLDNRLWAFGGLILVACLQAYFRSASI
jgi:hypothetical protein